MMIANESKNPLVEMLGGNFNSMILLGFCFSDTLDLTFYNNNSIISMPGTLGTSFRLTFQL